MPQTIFETAPTTTTATGTMTGRHTDEYLFDPFAPPAHLSLDLAPAENLFGDSSSEHASDPSDELLYFGAPATDATTVQPPPMFPVLNVTVLPPHVPKVKKARKAAEANIMKEHLAQFAQQEQQQQQQQQQSQQQQQFSVALPVPAPPQHLVVPAVPAAASTTVLTEDDEYGSNASSDDEEEDVKPRARRATAKAAARLDDSSSGDEMPGNKLKRKQMAGVGAPPQRTQLTKAELELGATLDLSRDELLNMTSDALEEHAKRLASQRTLTPEEQKRFKRQRRLIKNRESAQLSRMRKKAYVDELERQIADLKEEKDEIRRRADNAERQLAQARAETAQLRALLAQNPTLAAPLSALAMPEVPVAVELESSKRRRGAGGVTLL